MKRSIYGVLSALLVMFIFSTGMAFAEPATWNELGTGSTSGYNLTHYYNAEVIMVDAPATTCPTEESCVVAMPCVVFSAATANNGNWSGVFDGASISCNWGLLTAEGEDSQGGGGGTINNDYDMDYSTETNTDYNYSAETYDTDYNTNYSTDTQNGATVNINNGRK